MFTSLNPLSTRRAFDLLDEEVILKAAEAFCCKLPSLLLFQFHSDGPLLALMNIDLAKQAAES